MPAVSNSSPLIYLSALGDLELIFQLFGDLIIPQAVYREVVIDGQGQPGAREVAEASARWIRVVTVQNPAAVDAIRAAAGLQGGESESIVLA